MGPRIFFLSICTSQPTPAPLYESRRAAAIARLTLKRVGIGLDDTEREKIAILMLET
jgi:hypothetical protein